MALEAIYIGPRLDMIAECSSMDPCSIGVPEAKAKYLIQPIGDDDYDVDWCSRWSHAVETAEALARETGVPVRYVGGRIRRTQRNGD